MVLVKIEQGWLSGQKLHTFQGEGQYYSFKGIPYAAPPLGKLRFKAPQPPLPWEGIREANKHGPKCPQMDIFTDNIQLGNEDCLSLNVYTPQLKPTSPLPVMIFIHGGGFKSGSGNSKNYGADFLITHEVILVTFNYRLEVLGFLCLNTKEVPGNAGLKDQVAALKWVKSNIANFGGDPNNVTLIGHSSGGVCAALHILSPMSKGLFKRVISMSGVPFCDWATPFLPQKRSYVLGKQLGLDTDDPNVLLEFLQNIPTEKIIRTSPTVFSFEELNNNPYKMYYFTPVVEQDFGEEHFLTENPLIALENGRINDVDVFLGHTSEEALIQISVFEKNLSSLINLYNRYPELLVPKKIQMVSNPYQILKLSKRIHDYYFKGKPITIDTIKEFIRYISESSFTYDINRFMSKLSKVGEGRRYMYKFSSISRRNVYSNPGLQYGIKGMSHLDDLMYLLHASLYNIKLEKDTKEYELVQLACTIFTNFAKYGNPTPDSSLGIIWPEYNSMTKPYVDIGDTLTPGTNAVGEDTYQFWRSIYEEVGMEY